MEIIFQLHVRSYLTFPMYSRGPVLMPCFSPLSSVTELVGVEYRRTVGVVYQMFFSVSHPAPHLLLHHRLALVAGGHHCTLYPLPVLLLVRPGTASYCRYSGIFKFMFHVFKLFIMSFLFWLPGLSRSLQDGFSLSTMQRKL